MRWRRLARGDFLRVDEVEAARKFWVRAVQRAAYQHEVESLERGDGIKRKSPIFRLSPYLDEVGILIVGGRIRHSILPPNQRHPAILPAGSHLTKLIVAVCHKETLHVGVQATLAHVRQAYWIPHGRTTVKTYIHHCVRWRAAPVEQRMADLPFPRVRPSRPFLHTGVDYAGPVLVHLSLGRGCKTRKGFICVFVCFSSRAVHLEIVSDYTAEGFLAALRRFVSRRGLPSDLYSDQGTKSTGANTKLRALFMAAEREVQKLLEGVELLRTKWHFNPPSSPHFGGLWEDAALSP